MSKRPGLTTDEEQRIKSLLAMGKTYNAIGKEIGRDAKTVKKLALQSVAEIYEMKKELADWYEDLAKRMLSSITEADIDRINAYQRTVSAGIATDKMRLLRGESTDNVTVIAALIQEAKAHRREEARLLAGASLDRNELDDDPGIPPNRGSDKKENGHSE
ncbi:MAG TPA: hypothetical protein PLR20_08050 [Syntrophales bacterium]|nr:hypothetical protein [Syntrophales bacterium]HPI58073.1 hypothetical protein [Syntrophales bacterium]HPN25289.1 hypothetical protein [Syntrophales bacterium]HQM29292.1 hypothetical protein [Syntrophales bacterium]